MKEYPHIPHWKEAGIMGLPIYAFDKLDGSNVRFEWSAKKGWWKFGSRHHLIDKHDSLLGGSIKLFLNKYGAVLDEHFRANKPYQNCKGVVVFAEYFGPNSFAGTHDPNDIMDVVMFEVNPIGKNFLGPKAFVQEFSDLDIPTVIYQGNFNKQLIEDVRANTYGLREGVVCKGHHKGQHYLVKIKTLDWLERLKNTKGQKEAEMEGL